MQCAARAPRGPTRLFRSPASARAEPDIPCDSFGLARDGALRHHSAATALRHTRASSSGTPCAAAHAAGDVSSGPGASGGGTCGGELVSDASGREQRERLTEGARRDSKPPPRGECVSCAQAGSRPSPGNLLDFPMTAAASSALTEGDHRSRTPGTLPAVNAFRVP